MDYQKWSLRFGAAVIACALVLRLTAGGAFQPLADFLAQPNIASFLIYLETGRVVRFSSSEEDAPVFAGESAAPDFVEQEKAVKAPEFTAEDASLVEIKNNTSKKPDVVQLLKKPLEWNLSGEEPTVLIISTHTTESYTRSAGEQYEESSAFRTLDERYNMLSIGDHLAQLLEEGGLTVLHDRQLHDYPSYNGSYNDARKSIEQYLKEYPSIRLVLDIHRDAAGDNTNQMTTSATVDGKDSAQLMIVVGSNGSGLNHPDWQENMALALKLHVQLERLNPGICRPINLRSQRFNQDESPGALLIEVGAAGNTHAEAITAVEVLAEGVIALASGANLE